MSKEHRIPPPVRNSRNADYHRKGKISNGARDDGGRNLITARVTNVILSAALALSEVEWEEPLFLRPDASPFGSA